MTQTPGSGNGDAALQAALRRLLAPLARLAVSRGMPHAVLDELLRQALVKAADDSLREVSPNRRVSRISTTTGLHRREASRLLQALRDGEHAAAVPRPSRASQVLAHWLSSPAFTDRRGRPRVLPRQGPAPSFETLAREITRDVHPRGVLDELVRLGMVEVDAARDKVRLAAGAAVPRGDQPRMLEFLAANGGDHLAGAVDNVLGTGRRHFEQAVFADSLGVRSLDEVRPLVSGQWQALLKALVPALEGLVERDQGRADATHRLRIGLYTYDDGPAAARRPDPEHHSPAPQDQAP